MRKLAPLYLLLLLGAFGWGIVSLLQMRFGGGDIYPPGSSLRVDRQGTRVLHDSLARLRPVIRNYSTLEGQNLHRVTVLFLHTSAPQIADSNWKTLTQHGARVVFAFAPVLIERAQRDLKALDVTLTYSTPTEEMQDTPAWRASRDTTLTLQPGSPSWTIVEPGQILERPYGQGSLVLVANADLFSNQTLAEQRAPALLSRLIGPADRIVFEETHLGVRDDPGVMVLVRRYGLLGLLLALLTLAALFVWQAVFPLVPLPAEASESFELHSSRTAESGLAQLLRRGIPPSGLIAACEHQWERTANPTPQQRQAVRAALRDTQHPAAAFARATLALERKR